MRPSFVGEAGPDRPSGSRLASGLRGAFGILALLGTVLFLGSEGLQAQEVGGQVVDATSGRPLVGAQILVEGTQIGTLADSRGRFVLSGVSGESVTLRIVTLGYRELSETVEVGRMDLTFRMTQQALALDAISVTGVAGGTQTRALGNTVGRLDAAQMQEVRPSTNVQEMLSSQVPGVRIMATGGEVGAGGISRIRGTSSVSLGGTPLVYIDGIRVEGGDSTPGVGTLAFRGGEQPSRINDLQPEDIESVEVIKGPAAATLYGTEASNGVINIITKRGSSQDPTVNLRLRQGAYWLPDPINFFPTTYYRCSGVSQTVDVHPRLQCNPGETTAVRILEIEREVYGNEWFRTGQMPGVGADISGGTDRLRYFFSADWDREEGYVNYNSRDRMTARSNLGYTPSEQISFDFSFGVVRSRAQTASTQQPITTAILWACPAPGCEAGSTSAARLDGPRRGFIGFVPEVFEEDIEGFQSVDRATAGLTFNHNPTPWFTHRVVVGGDFTTLEDTRLWRATGRFGNNNPAGRRDVGNTRTVQGSLDYGANAIWNATDDLVLTTSAGAQYYRRSLSSTLGTGLGFPLLSLETLSAASTRNTSEEYWENKSFGIYFQEQIGWRNRVFLTAAVRGDDNSAFGENFSFVTYPKFSGSWVLSEEPFMEDMHWLSTLRFRGAWGRAGQQPDVFDAVQTYEPVDGFDGESAITPDNVGNPDLKPEVGSELEIGFDASFLDERISLEFTHFRQRTTDALIRVPTLPSLGFPGFQFQNIGETKNSGIEIGLNARAYQSPDLSVDLGFTLASAKNEVVSLGSESFVIQNVTEGQYHVEGFPIGSLFAKRVVSADIVEQQPRNTVTNIMCEGGERVPGTNFSRGGGSAVPCSEAPLVYWGQPLPVWEGSFSTSVTIRQNLSLYGLVDFIQGRTWINGDIRSAHHSFLNTRSAVEANEPILLSYITMGADGRPQPGIMSGDFAKLRTISLQYRLPQSWAEQVRASRLSVTAAAENLAILWQGDTELFGHPSMDPERGRQTGGATPGINALHQEGWPIGRRITTTIRVTF